MLKRIDGVVERGERAQKRKQQGVFQSCWLLAAQVVSLPWAPVTVLMELKVRLNQVFLAACTSFSAKPKWCSRSCKREKVLLSFWFSFLSRFHSFFLILCSIISFFLSFITSSFLLPSVLPLPLSFSPSPSFLYPFFSFFFLLFISPSIWIFLNEFLPSLLHSFCYSFLIISIMHFTFFSFLFFIPTFIASFYYSLFLLT